MIQLLLLVALSIFYLCSCPYTKVEESFNLQVRISIVSFIPWKLEYVLAFPRVRIYVHLLKFSVSESLPELAKACSIFLKRLTFQAPDYPNISLDFSWLSKAMHDLLFHKTRLDAFDHLEFPGVVPRTFIGPLFVTFWVAPLASVLDLMGFGKDVAQVILKFIVGYCSILHTYTHTYVELSCCYVKQYKYELVLVISHLES